MCVALCTVSIPVDFSGITDSIVKHVPKSLGYTLGYRLLVFSLFITEPFKVYFGEAHLSPLFEDSGQSRKRVIFVSNFNSFFQ